MKAFKAFIKPFETPQGSVKIIFFSVRSGWRWEGLKLTLNITIVTNYDLCYSIFEDSENTENTLSFWKIRSFCCQLVENKNTGSLC